MILLCVYTSSTVDRAAVEERLGISLRRGIENGWYGSKEAMHVVLAPFGVLTVIADDRPTVDAALSRLGIILHDGSDAPPYQDYALLIDPEAPEPYTVSNEAVTLRHAAPLNLNIVALAVSQSVGLEQYEERLERLFAQSRTIVESIHKTSFSQRTALLKFAKKLALTRHDMVRNLLLLDKPNILWDNEEAEGLYNRMAFILELHDRHEIALTKLAQIQEDVMLVMDLINHKKSEFLEWIIILLILFEIVMGLAKLL